MQLQFFVCIPGPGSRKPELNETHLLGAFSHGQGRIDFVSVISQFADLE